MFQQVTNYKVLQGASRRDTVSIPIFGADFKTNEFTITGAYILEVDTFNSPNFVYGEGMVILGGTSGATGKIVFITDQDGVDATLIVNVTSGTFVSGEVLTVTSSPIPQDPNIGVTTETVTVSAAPDFTIQALGSNDENPPDLSLPSNVGNEYYDIAYTDSSTQSTYDGSTPYHPTVQETRNFQLETNGVRWWFVKMVLHTAGAIGLVKASNFSNYV